MAGFTESLGWTLSRFGVGMVNFPVVEVVVTSGLVVLNAVAFVGTLSAARRWGILSEPDSATALPTALLAGLGFALGLGFGGGDYAILLHPIQEPLWFDAIQVWLPLPHFVAAAALALRGRLAVPAALLVSVAGMVIALGLLVALMGFGELQYLLDSVALWSLFLLNHVTAAGFLAFRWSPGHSQVTSESS